METKNLLQTNNKTKHASYSCYSMFQPYKLKMMLFIFLVCISCIGALDPIVDVALSRPVTANFTCGFRGPERFFSQVHTGIQGSKHLQICENTKSYPATNINDGDDQTWWQSTSRLSFIAAGYGIQGKPDAFINIDLQQEFQVETVTVRFGESLRPGKMLFYKQLNGPMVPWFYRVTSAVDCQNLYNLPVSSLPSTVTSIPCTTYTTPAVLEEVIQFDFSITPAELKDWNKVRAVKIEFYDIDLTLGVSSGSNEFQHYTVRAINIFAKCSCNGQLTDCVVNNDTKKYECVCGGFTTGEFCQRCKPLYNNKPYKFATPCEMCNCNNQSPSCVYDTLRSRGVCDACGNFTSGLSCETCMDGYYRPTGVLPSDPGPCKACSCSGVFSTGQCLKTADPVYYPGMIPGDCLCKPNVVGKLCDKCRDGFYDISVLGCKDCACQANGTVASSISCDSKGQCACKKYTMGLRCDRCVDGYFNIDPSNPEGCIPCNCDPGGSVKKNCDKVTGVCQCRLGIEGRTCNKPTKGYFYPEFNHFSAEMERLESPWEKTLPEFSGFGYVSPLKEIPVTTTIDMSSITDINPKTFRIILRYFSTVDVAGTLGVGPNDVITSTLPITLTACTGRGQWCFVPSNPLTIFIGSPLKVSLTFSEVPANARLSLDSVSAVPTAFFNASDILDPLANSDFLTKCNVLINHLNVNAALREECSKYAFSIFSYILNGALLCGCDGLGANATDSCNSVGGQCFCKPFVTGRRCDKCVSKYFGLTLAGCSACNCSSTSYDMCNPITGTCLCPPGAEGVDCSSCQLNYYNWDRVRGCMPCGCNSVGSTSLACDVTSGACTCKPGVMGIKCDQCKDGYWRLNVLGCEKCSCDENGSVTTKCDKSTGACQCKTNVQGQWCNTCKLNSFSMTSFSPDGCLKCSCMGVSSTCSPSNFITAPFNLNPLSSSIVLVDNKGSSYIASTPSVDPSTGMSAASLPARADIYWSIADVKGDILSLYGSKVTWNAQWTAGNTAVPTIFPQNPAVLIIGKNGQQFLFQIANFTTPPAGQTNLYSVKNVLTSIDDYSLAGITRGKILLALSDIKAFMIPAVFTQNEHQSSIGDVAFELDPNLVESCLCPPGYEGRSCERCSVGYTRVNVSSQGFLGNCAPCSCNGKATTCNVNTGECSNCKDFTTGFSCENCLHGHYRDPNDGPSGDCKKCPCEGPRVQSNDCGFVNNTLTCLNCTTGYKGTLCNICKDDYYGDLSVSLMNSCRPCLCNGHSTKCDLNGICQNCNESTTGDKCESCIPGKYLSPTTMKCDDCNCNTTGSISTICNVETGQCSCKDGIVSRICDQCDTNFYQFSVDGCKNCLCNEYGSQNLQCNDLGICPCKSNTTNDKCDTCLAGYYGITNNKPCALCNCDPLGTEKNMLYQCDSTTGQCICTTNVVGRRCEKCKSLYYSPTEILNCIKCGQCETSLGEDILKMENKSRIEYLQLVADLKILTEYDVELAKEQKVLDGFCALLGTCGDTVNVYAKFKENVTAMSVQSKQWKDKADNMNSEVTSINTILQQLNEETHVLLSQVQQIKQQTDKISRDYASQMSLSMAAISRLSTSNTSAYMLWQGPPYNASTFVALPWTHADMFDGEKAGLDALDTRTKALATRATELNNQLSILLQQVSGIQTSVRTAEELFTSTSSEIQQLNNTITSSFVNLGTLTVTTNNIINIKASADSNFKRVHDIVLSTGFSLQETSSSLQACQQKLAQTDLLITGLWTIKPPIYDQTGFRGWDQAYFLVNRLWETSSNSLSASKGFIEPAEAQATALATKASSIRITFDSVKGRGQTAVDVINKFEDVIRELETSITQAATINSTLHALTNFLNTVPVSELTTQAGQVLAASNELKNAFDALNAKTNIISLNNRLDQAIKKFKESVSMWTRIDDDLVAFNKEYQGLQTFVNNLTPKLNSDYEQGISKSNEIKNKINILNNQHNGLLTSLNTMSTSVVDVSQKVAESYTIQSGLSANMSTFRVTLDQAARTSLNATNVTQILISSKRLDLESKFNAADEMLKRIQNQITSMEQPVFFASNTYEQLINPGVNQDPMHNSISLQFMFPQSARGVLFFVENNLSNEKLLIQLLNFTVCFSVGNTQTSTVLCNYAKLNAREWYSVYATRYGMDLKLTVTRQSTGGSVSVSASSSLTTVLRINLNTPLYVGGLALNLKNIQKVYDSGIGFNGCIYKLVFNGAIIPLWSNILKTDSSAGCCKIPPSLSFEEFISPCTTFYGFGHVFYNPSPTFNINPEAQIYLQFRTFMGQGVILLVSSFSTQNYYGVFLQNGRVVFSIFTQNNLLSISSDLSYANGKWYQLSVAHTPTKMSLRLDSTGDNPINLEYKEKSGTITLTSLNGAILTLGGQNPSLNRGPVTEGFSGHMKNLKHSTDSSATLVDSALTVNVSLNVNFKSCLKEVREGLALRDSGRVTYLSKLSPIQTIDFTFITTKPSGLIFYSLLQQSSNDLNTFLYVALYNGDIFVLFNQGKGVQTPLKTSNLNLADGRVHRVSLHFGFVNSPRLKVDNLETNVGIMNMDSFMKLRDNNVFLGGVPSSVSLDTIVIPVETSFLGGIEIIKFNDVEVPFMNTGVLTPSNSRQVDLSGLMVPRQVIKPPCDPCPTTPTHLTCVSPPTLTNFYGEDTFNFGEQTESFLQYSIVGQENNFLHDFVFQFKFKSIQPDGLLIYVANSATSFLTDYYAIYLHKGFINVLLMNSNVPKSVISKKTYYDGNWHSLLVFRVGDFLAILVEDSVDFNSNNQDSSVRLPMTNFIINSPLYVGGVPSNITLFPPSVPIGKTSLKGCVSSMSIQFRNYNIMEFPQSKIIRKVGVSLCAVSKQLGMLMTSSNSYVRASDAYNPNNVYNVAPTFKISLTFKTLSQDGVLMVAWSSASSFVALSLVNGEFQLVIGSATEPFVLLTDAFKTAFDACNNQFHSVELNIETSAITITVDETYKLRKTFNGSTFTFPLSVPIYLGGVKEPTWSIPNLFSGNSLSGCIQRCIINDVVIFITQSPEVKNALSGCN